MSTTQHRRRIRAPRAQVYRALTDPQLLVAWKVPPGMTGEVHTFEARIGGAFRVSLSYRDESSTGKSSAHTDTYHGHFAELVPDERVVEVMVFESDDPALQGEMTVTTTLTDVDGATELVAVHEGLPPGVEPSDNEQGWRESLDKLAALLERR